MKNRNALLKEKSDCIGKQLYRFWLLTFFKISGASFFIEQLI